MSAAAVVSIYDYGSLKPSTDLPTSLTPSLHFVTMLQKSILPAPPLPTALGTVTLLCVCVCLQLCTVIFGQTLFDLDVGTVI